MMRKIFFILILGVFTKGLGQTVPSYTYLFSQTFTHNINYEWYSYDERLYNPSNSSFVDLTGDNKLFISSPRDTFVNYNVPVDLNINSYWFEIWGYRALGSELDDFQNSISIKELIKGSIYKHRDGEAYSVLTPNDLSISNLGTTEVCAGEMLNLIATPAGFHPEVYQWQYSLDGEITWIDVPTKKVNGLDINNVVQSYFTIYDILGDDHVNHFGPIHFRLGYNHVDTMFVHDSDRLLSNNSIQINYTACAPVVTDLKALQPNCSGYPTTVIVTFDRPLDATKNEKLKNFQIINKNGQLTGNQIPEISAFDITNPLQFTYNNVTGLENGEKYTIIYQAFQGAIERGVPLNNLDFPYKEPPPFTFSLSETIPLCHNTNGAVTINVSGGTPPYGYILDNETEEIDGEIVPKKIIFSGDSKTISLTPVTHSIKVTDDKGCIDKTATQ